MNIDPLEYSFPATAPSEGETDISVVIACYNEEETVGELYRRLTGVLQSIGRRYEIIFINDGSTDRTLEILKDFRRDDPQVKIIVLTRNFGQQPAASAGIRHAKGRIIVNIDADLENQPEDLPRFLAKLEEGYDVVRGVRRGQQRALWRKIASRTMVAIISWMIGRKYTDFSSYLVLRRDVVENLLKFPERSRYSTVLLNMVGGSFAEVEIACPPRHAGESKYGLLKLISVTLDLFTGYSRVPVHAILVTGLVLVPVGVLLWLLPAEMLGGGPGGKLLLGLGFFIGGLQLMAIGIVGEYVVRIYTEAQARPYYLIKEILE